MTPTEPKATAPAGRYFADLAGVLAARGIESSRVERAIHHLEHGLGDEGLPLERYGPVDDLADAVVEAFSVRGRVVRGLMLVVAACAAIVVGVALIALRDKAEMNVVISEGQPLPFAADDRVLKPLLLASLAFAPAVAYLASGGNGYLLALWPGNGVGLRERSDFGKRPVRLQRMMRVVSLSLGLFLLVQALIWVVVPPNYGDFYLVAPATLLLAIAAAAVVGIPALLAHVLRRRVPVTGEVRYLLRDPDDMLHNAPGRVVQSGQPF